MGQRVFLHTVPFEEVEGVIKGESNVSPPNWIVGPPTPPDRIPVPLPPSEVQWSYTHPGSARRSDTQLVARVSQNDASTPMLGSSGNMLTPERVGGASS